MEISHVEPLESVKHRHEVRSDDVPGCLEEYGCEAIWPRCLVGGGGGGSDLMTSRTSVSVKRLERACRSIDGTPRA
jgi:hypothetical protein